MFSESSYQNPEYWHNLFIRLKKSKDPSEVMGIINEVSSLKLADPSSDILRLTFLSEFYLREGHIRRAGLRVVDLSNVSIDAIAAFASLYCISPLKLKDREQFLGAICNAQLPKIISRLNKIAQTYIQDKMNVRISQKLERITIITSYIGNAFHTPSRLVINYASMLKKLDINVNIISCQELLPNKMMYFHGAGRCVDLPALDTHGLSNLMPGGVVALVTNELEMPSRWTVASQWISQFDPDLILCIGPYSPLASALYSWKPIVALPTNAVSFMGSADIWLNGSDHLPSDAEVTWSGEFPLPKTHFHPFRIPKNNAINNLSREQLGIDPDALVLVTVGFRLAKEIEGDWAAKMLETISQHRQIVWVLIGDSIPGALVNAPTGKIINLSGRDDVQSVLKLCDIYVNPPRMGGGFSVLEAMSAGLAALAFCNTDGGEKIGQYAARDQAMYFSILHELILSKEKRISLGRDLQERFARYYDIEASGPSLIEACNKAIEQAKLRLKDAF
jgi:glycosyltransferase involved in cell wall biosynthesis